MMIFLFKKFSWSKKYKTKNTWKQIRKNLCIVYVKKEGGKNLKLKCIVGG